MVKFSFLMNFESCQHKFFVYIIFDNLFLFKNAVHTYNMSDTDESQHQNNLDVGTLRTQLNIAKQVVITQERALRKSKELVIGLEAAITSTQNANGASQRISISRNEVRQHKDELKGLQDDIRLQTNIAIPLQNRAAVKDLNEKIQNDEQCKMKLVST